MSSDTDEMVSAVEQWLRDNPPLTNAALYSQIAQLQAELADLRQTNAEQATIIIYYDGERDKARAELAEAREAREVTEGRFIAQVSALQIKLAEAREVPGRIVDWLREKSDKRHDKGYGREAQALSDVSDAIEARDWSKP